MGFVVEKVEPGRILLRVRCSVLVTHILPIGKVKVTLVQAVRSRGGVEV
jgi:hypothetical protein